eukprot:9654388-Prorocentrum_lima.AAC.1
MTSSLVGSEMCIRDRSSTGGHADFTEQKVRLERTIFSSPNLPHLLPFIAVSYTHLTLPTICSV